MTVRRFTIIFFKIVLCISIVFIAVHYENLFRRAAAVIAYPFLVAQHTVVRPLQHWLLWNRGVEDLTNVAEKLVQERNALRAQVIALEASLNYIHDCQELIDFKKRYNNASAITAQVLFRMISPDEQFFFVNAGSQKGVCQDMVAVYDNILVGRVSEVYPRYCKVILVTDKDCCVAATCAQTGARGIYRGGNSQTQNTLDYVNHLDTLQKDDLVLSLGDGMIFPRGFALGTIKSYQLEGVTYKVTVEPLLELSTLEFCTLLKRE